MRTNNPALFLRALLCLTILSALCLRAESQTISSSAIAAQASTAQARITQAIDEKNLVVLKGNVHPLARAEFDGGAVSDAQPLHRMLLLLQRSPAQETALQSLLDAQQDKSSPNYHQWLTPAQFGQQFGPADADIQAVTSWLQSHGFQVTNVTAGRTLIEFSGNAAQIRNAFHTVMHTYAVNGETHIANASDPQIPAALAPVVVGPVSLNNFPIQSHLRRLGTFQRSKATGATKPLFTFPGCREGNCFGLGPADFATIYNSAPLLTQTKKIDGTGQTIAIVGETDIDVTDVTDFKTMFGLPQNFSHTNVFVNGADPGINGSEGESDLDVQWAGAVAPGATVDFVTSQPTETTAGIFLSAIYIVENNFAGVMSESFGACENSIGTENQFHNSLWEQAAAQGITVTVSAGDNGSAGCDNFNTQETATRGLAVSGFASTPFNVAVGGTDFDDANRWSQFWSTTNNSTTLASALGYIPEIPWNDSCAQLGINGCGASAPQGSLDIVAGSGGVSSLYSKPLWQSGTGVPADGHRDIPDVSLFASNGFDGSFYVVCQKDVTDVPSCNSAEVNITFQGVGGTSASAPAFAGVMALVNQGQATTQNPAPRQGNANYVLYQLFKKQTNANPAINCNSSGTPSTACTFYDVTKGNSALSGGSTGTNSVPCAGNSTNCSSKTSGTNGVVVTTANPSTPAYSTTAGYDLPTGLGSVNIANLVNNWGSVTFLSSMTTLTATLNGSSVTSITGIAHGTPVNVSTSVAPGQGGTGTPSGQVSLMATPNPTPGSTSTNLGVEAFALTNGTATGTGVVLPGGTYTLTAHYPGDGTFGSSDSTPGISVNITSESSKTLISIPIFNPTTGAETGNTPASLVYGSPYIARIDVGNSKASLSFPSQPACTPPACPTGTITWTDSYNGAPAAPLDGGTFTLNSDGYTEDQVIELTGGTHQLTATYSGDNSFGGSSGTYTLSVAQAPTQIAPIQTNGGSNPVVGQPFQVTVNGTGETSTGAAPTGTISFFVGGTQIGSAVNVSGTSGQNGANPFFSAGENLTILSSGQQTLTAKYSGDSNYAPSNSQSLVLNVLNSVTASVTASPSNIIYGNPVTITAIIDTKVSSSNVVLAPSGSVSFASAIQGNLTGTVSMNTMTDTNGNWEILATISVIPSNTEVFFANYTGDNNYASVGAASNLVVVTIPDFNLNIAPNSLAITSGQSASSTLTVTPQSNSSSVVDLTCNTLVTIGITCSMTPPSVNLANGASAVSTLSVTMIAASGASPDLLGAKVHPLRAAWPLHPVPTFPIGALASLILVACLGIVFRERRRFALGLALIWIVAVGCGGGSAQIIGGGGLSTTSIVLTASATKAPVDSTISLTATVTSTRAITGSVTFWIQGSGGALTPPIGLQGNSASAQVDLSLYGTYQVYAQYSGDDQNQGSQSPVVNVVSTGTTFVQIAGTTGSNIHNTGVTITIQ